MSTGGSGLPSKIMHPGFYFFPEIVPRVSSQFDRSPLVPVQIVESLLLNALNIFVFPVTTNGVQRILNLSISGDTLDFHLTFTLEAATDKIKPDAHFALRKEKVSEDSSGGHNEVLYWWYQFSMHPTTKALYWVWTGCAGKGDAAMMAKNRTPGVQYGTTVEDILQRLLNQLKAESSSLAVHPRSRRWTLS